MLKKFLHGGNRNQKDYFDFLSLLTKYAEASNRSKDALLHAK
jgi:hypothetical protein